jgi:hypothetical protein
MEGHQVGGHQLGAGGSDDHDQDDNEQLRAMPDLQGWRPSARCGMHLRRNRAHLRTRDLVHLRR